MKIDNDKLYVAMANEGLLLKELCQKAEIAEVTLRQIRTGVRNPKPATIGKIARALNVNVEEIICNE